MYDPQISQDSTPVSLQSIGIYAGLTAVFLTILIILTNSLAQSPRYLPGSSALIPPGWTMVTDSDQTFTFHLPNDWQQYQHSDDPTAPFVTALEENPGVETAVSLFRRIDPATQISLVAIDGIEAARPPFVFVAHSSRMSQLAPTTLAAAVSSEVPNIGQIELVDRPGGQTAVIFTLELPIRADTWRCLYQFTKNDRAGYVVSSCAPRSEFSHIRNELSAMQNSFQLLIR